MMLGDHITADLCVANGAIQRLAHATYRRNSLMASPLEALFGASPETHQRSSMISMNDRRNCHDLILNSIDNSITVGEPLT
jgi:hypothetical protein